VPDRSLRRDERAIEGLPIRLVIALVVGVASLGVMMNTISGLGSLGVSELDVQPEPEVVPADNRTDVTVTVVDPEGEPVANATVIAQSGDARLDGLVVAETGYNGTATLSVEPELGPNQAKGTVGFEVQPPSGDYDDRRENTALLVIEE
jgi:hypothetical protein